MNKKIIGLLQPFSTEEKELTLLFQGCGRQPEVGYGYQSRPGSCLISLSELSKQWCSAIIGVLLILFPENSPKREHSSKRNCDLGGDSSAPSTHQLHNHKSPLQLFTETSN